MSSHKDNPNLQELFETQKKNLAVLAAHLGLERLANEVDLQEELFRTINANIEIAKARLFDLDKDLNNRRAIHEPAVIQLRDLEATFNELHAAAEKSHLATDRIRAHKADIEIMKIKPRVLEDSIKVLEVEVDLEVAREEVLQMRVEAANISANLEALQLKQAQLKADVDREQSPFDMDWVKQSIEVKKEQAVEDAYFELESAKIEILKLHEEVRVLKQQIEDGKSATILNLDVDGVQKIATDSADEVTALRLTIKELESQLKDKTRSEGDLVAKIASMKYLYDIGSLTRLRKIHFELRRFGTNVMDSETFQQSNKAVFDADVLADASMFVDGAYLKRPYAAEFERCYGISASRVWEHKEFGKFLHLLNMKNSVKKNNPPSKATFEVGFQKIFAQIVPKNDRSVETDEELEDREDLIRIYKELEVLAKDAEAQAGANRANGSHASGTFTNGTHAHGVHGNGVNNGNGAQGGQLTSTQSRNW